MSISFDQIPNQIPQGGYYTEIHSTGAGVGVGTHKALLVVPKRSTGTLSVTAPQKVISSSEADRLCGAGSLGAEMLRRFMTAAPAVEVWAIAFAGTTPATCAVTVTATNAKAGTIALYVGGERVAVPVTAGMTATEIAAAIVSAVTAKGLFVAATNAEGVVTLTALDSGTIGNTLLAQLDLFDGDQRAEPAGVSVAFAASGVFANGAGAFDAEDIVEAIAGKPFDTIVWPDTVAANLTEWAEELLRRFGPEVEQDGMLFAAVAGNVAEATTAASTLNSPFICLMGTSDSPTPPCLWASALAAADAAEPDPARPRRTLPLREVRAPSETWDSSERRSAILGGVATWTVDAGGNVLIDREVTTYRVNADGRADTSFREVTTLRVLAYLRRDWEAYINGRYPRHKLADDGTDFPPSQAIVQPSTIRADSIVRYRTWIDQGLVQDLEGFKQGLIVERRAGDANRLDCRMKVVILGKFLTLATRMDFEQ